MKGIQRGSLIVEMMVSTLIGTVLLYGALSIMLNSRITYLAREGLSSNEGRGLLALEILANDIRASGYRGCVSGGDQTIIRGFDSSHDWFMPEVGIRGWEYSQTEYGDALSVYGLSESPFSGSSWLPSTTPMSAISNATLGSSGITPIAINGPLTIGSSTAGITEIAKADEAGRVDMLEGSDVLELWVAQPYVLDINRYIHTTPGYFEVVPETMTGFPEGLDDHERLLVVSDCERNMLLQTKLFNHVDGRVNLGTTNLNALQLYEFRDRGQALMIQGVMYYLALPSGRDRPSLYRKEINSDGSYKNAEEVVPSVLNLQFLYGENLDNGVSANTYVEADSVTDWSRVVSVRIFMLLETERNNAADQGLDYFYFGQNYSPEDASDKRIRREYTMTVTLRNRALGLAVLGNGN